MDQVTKIKNQYRAEQWANVIKECQASGQTVTSWCESHDVGIKAYYYWLRKLRMATIQKSNPNALVEVPKEEPAVFKKLEVQTPVPNTQAAVVIHLNGATIEVNEGTSQQTIQAVLLALRDIC